MELMLPLALGKVVDSVINGWIGPVFIIIVAGIAIVLAFQKRLAAFLSFAGVAVLAALFIFFGNDLFGKSGNVTKAGKKISDKINAIQVVDLNQTTFSQDFLKLDR